MGCLIFLDSPFFIDIFHSEDNYFGNIKYIHTFVFVHGKISLEKNSVKIIII